MSAGDIVRSEVDLMVGRATFLMRSTTSRYPRTARAIKRILGLPIDDSAGATAWAERHRLIPAPGPHLASPTSRF